MNEITTTAPLLGRIQGLSNAEYHGGPGVSSSELKLLLKSFLHWEDYQKEKAEEREKRAAGESDVSRSKDARDKGSLVHALLLEPHTVDAEYALMPDPPANMLSNVAAAKAALAAAGQPTKATKAEEVYDAVHQHLPNAMTPEKWKKQLQKLAQQKTLMHPSDWADAHACAQAVLTNPETANYFTGGWAEESYYAIDEVSGLLRKCRLDYMKIEDGFIHAIDIKTIRDASGDACDKEVGDREYLLSAAYYLDTLAMVCGIPVDENTFRCMKWTWVFCENERPYGVRVKYATYDDLMLGRAVYQHAFSRYREHMQAQAQGRKLFAGYDHVPAPLELPPWRRRQYAALSNSLINFTNN
jgi:exodeoxyribonuclease VIII